MYCPTHPVEPTPEKFELSAKGQLSPDNRWVILAELIPWSDFEAEYQKNFSANMGAPALSFRIALGALIIKEKLGTSDRETVEQIRENPYLQYFLGQSSYSCAPLFEASMFVHFRKRISLELVNKVNIRILEQSRVQTAETQPQKKTSRNRKIRGS